MRSRHRVLAAVMFVLLVVWVLALSEYAGDSDPTYPPESTSSYSLEDIYNRLVTGAEDGPRPFTEPTDGPGTATMHTLNDIMDKAPVADNTYGATKAEVAHGKKYWSLRTDGSDGSDWGEETGSLHGGCTCTGTMNGTRWCDNGDGTVTDLTTCLVWLKKADWGGQKMWVDGIGYDDAHTRAGILKAGSAGADLSDGSTEGDWRLPTKTELYDLTHGTEQVRSDTPRAFSGVELGSYWSSTTLADLPNYAWIVVMSDGSVHHFNKSYSVPFVWPVRGEQ
ncbi:MAG: DUF1566 domain-containing protein [Gemmatimonadota bacterium]|nr:MAG: DUF1566 domain-containing protein [Gemmatimonadota bacterium]